MAPLSQWRKGLFTREDKFNVHKLCGFPVLAHYAIRIAAVPRDTKNLRFDGSLLTPACLAVHLMLSCTSLVFHIPTKRIKEGSRIWPEFRLHSIVFACRSLACMTLVWIERRYALEPMYLVNVAIVFATLIGADVASASVDHHSNTIRGLETSAAYKFAFSFMQFLGTTGCLVGLRAFAGQFAIVFIIQVYAFTLTLRRKNLITHMQTVFIYSYQLSIGGAVAQCARARQPDPRCGAWSAPDIDAPCPPPWQDRDFPGGRPAGSVHVPGARGVGHAASRRARAEQVPRVGRDGVRRAVRTARDTHRARGAARRGARVVLASRSRCDARVRVRALRVPQRAAARGQGSGRGRRGRAECRRGRADDADDARGREARQGRVKGPSPRSLLGEARALACRSQMRGIHRATRATGAINSEAVHGAVSREA